MASSPAKTTEGATERFTNRADDYRLARPSYSTDAVDFVLSNEGLGASCTIADIGSGTGILSGQLLDNSDAVLRLYGVEPNASMRALAESAMSSEPRFCSVDGTSENTGLSDSSVDAITVAQAFHWFDFESSRTEYRRIGRPGARAAVIWNSRNEGRDEFHRDYEAFLRTWGVGYLEVHALWQVKHRLRELFASGYREERFGYAQRLDVTALRSRFNSSSYAPAAQTKSYTPAIAALDMLFERHQSSGFVDMHYHCECYVGVL